MSKYRVRCKVEYTTELEADNEQAAIETAENNEGNNILWTQTSTWKAELIEDNRKEEP